MILMDDFDELSMDFANVPPRCRSCGRLLSEHCFVLVKCKFCENKTQIKDASHPVFIMGKKYQFIPPHDCSKCGKAYHPTFYEDIANELKDVVWRQGNSSLLGLFGIFIGCFSLLLWVLMFLSKV